MRASVDLPAPFGPITQTISPGATANDTPASASTGAPEQAPAQQIAQAARGWKTFPASRRRSPRRRRRLIGSSSGLPARWYFTTAALCSATVFEK